MDIPDRNRSLNHVALGWNDLFNTILFYSPCTKEYHCPLFLSLIKTSPHPLPAQPNCLQWIYVLHIHTIPMDFTEDESPYAIILAYGTVLVPFDLITPFDASCTPASPHIKNHDLPLIIVYGSKVA